MRLTKYLEFKESDLDPSKSFKLKDELNPKVWENFKINESISDKLVEIAEDFYYSTELEADIIDIALVGSLCNYNWSENYSDYDLHIVIEYSDINDDLVLVKKVCDLSKKVWNDYHDIKIEGYDVEVAIQDKADLDESIKMGKMGGVYSLLNDKWIKKPEKVDFEPDENLIEDKAKTIMTQIDEIIDESDDMEYLKLKEKIERVWDKVKRLRKSSLEEEGEFGIGNLVFKMLRRNGYIEKIIDIKRDKYDKQFK